MTKPAAQHAAHHDSAPIPMTQGLPTNITNDASQDMSDYDGIPCSHANALHLSEWSCEGTMLQQYCYLDACTSPQSVSTLQLQHSKPEERDVTEVAPFHACLAAQHSQVNAYPASLQRQELNPVQLDAHTTAVLPHANRHSRPEFASKCDGATTDKQRPGSLGTTKPMAPQSYLRGEPRRYATRKIKGKEGNYLLYYVVTDNIVGSAQLVAVVRCR
jgi:hypothetical protein